MAEQLKVGDSIPPFLAKDQEGYNVTDQDVIGCPLVIYFYPKDDTPGCAKEACSFEKNIAQFDKLQTLVVGVSPDTVESHKEFIKKHNLEFHLLSDEKKDMCHMFGVLDEKKNVIRTTFAIDIFGVIRWMEKPVEIKGHVDRALKAVEKHCLDNVPRYDDFEADYAKFLKGSLELSEDEKEMEKKIMKEFGLKENDLKEK